MPPVADTQRQGQLRTLTEGTRILRGFPGLLRRLRAKELFELLEKRTADVEELTRSVQGFVRYSLARSGEGGFPVTVCQDKAGFDESVQRAKDWIAENTGDTSASAPEVSKGSRLIHLK